MGKIAESAEDITEKREKPQGMMALRLFWNLEIENCN
jgi:hypothetical protein